MDKIRREKLEDAINLLIDVREEISEIHAEEEERYLNLPDSIKEGKLGQAMCENVNDLEDACGALEDLEAQLKEVLDR